MPDYNLNLLLAPLGFHDVILVYPTLIPNEPYGGLRHKYLRQRTPYLELPMSAMPTIYNRSVGVVGSYQPLVVVSWYGGEE